MNRLFGKKPNSSNNDDLPLYEHYKNAADSVFDTQSINNKINNKINDEINDYMYNILNIQKFIREFNQGKNSDLVQIEDILYLNFKYNHQVGNIYTHIQKQIKDNKEKDELKRNTIILLIIDEFIKYIKDEKNDDNLIRFNIRNSTLTHLINVERIKTMRNFVKKMEENVDMNTIDIAYSKPKKTSPKKPSRNTIYLNTSSKNVNPLSKNRNHGMLGGRKTRKNKKTRKSRK